MHPSQAGRGGGGAEAGGVGGSQESCCLTAQGGQLVEEEGAVHGVPRYPAGRGPGKSRAGPRPVHLATGRPSVTFTGGVSVKWWRPEAAGSGFTRGWEQGNWERQAQAAL